MAFRSTLLVYLAFFPKSISVYNLYCNRPWDQYRNRGNEGKINVDGWERFFLTRSTDRLQTVTIYNNNSRLPFEVTENKRILKQCLGIYCLCYEYDTANSTKQFLFHFAKNARNLNNWSITKWVVFMKIIQCMYENIKNVERLLFCLQFWNLLNEFLMSVHNFLLHKLITFAYLTVAWLLGNCLR